MLTGFDDASWPAPKACTNAEAGVRNEPAFRNSRTLFDDSRQDKQIIWLSSLVLDDEVAARFKVRRADRRAIDQAVGGTLILDERARSSPGIARSVDDALAPRLSIR